MEALQPGGARDAIQGLRNSVGTRPFELGEDGRIDPDLLPAPLQADNLDGARPDIDARKVPVPPKRT